jgi:hypothetical protein
MATNSTVNGYPSNDSNKLPLSVEVLDFTYRQKNTFVGSANVLVKGLLPGCDLGIRGIGYFAPNDPLDPDDHPRCRFPNCKEGNKWQPQVWVTDSALHYRILGHARRAIQEYLKTHPSPTAAYDALAEDAPVSSESIVDEEIPF